MGHLEEALDDYADLPPDYLLHNPSVTSELLTGLYAGGFYTEVVNAVDFLMAEFDAEKLDGVNYARMVTELIKAKSKLGRLDEVCTLLDDAFKRRVLFLPLAYSDIISVCSECVEVRNRILRTARCGRRRWMHLRTRRIGANWSERRLLSSTTALSTR